MASGPRRVRGTLADGGGEAGSREEGPHRMLVGGDRAVGVREGGLEMCERLRGRGPAYRFRWRQGGRTPSKQRRADCALASIESFPDALQGSVAEMAVGGADRGGDAVGHGALEELPQPAARQAEPPDFVREPNAERATATPTCMAVAAKDPPSAHRFSPRAALVEAVQDAVPNQRAHRLAVRTRRLLEPLGDRDPIFFAAVKPSLHAHVWRSPRKSLILRLQTRAG